MRVFVAGASGFVGRALIGPLLAAGHDVRAGMRRPEGARAVRFDLDDEASLAPALAGCDAALYLVHGLDRDGFSSWEEETARRFADACRAAHVRRLVYLGGVVPTHRTWSGRVPSIASKHLAARLSTGRELKRAAEHVLELRAGVVVGAGGASFRMIRDVAARAPVLVPAPWLASEQQPIGLDDVVAAIVRSLQIDVDGAFDLPGPTTLTSEAFLRMTAGLLGNRVLFFDRPLDATIILQGIVRITRADPRVVLAILEGANGADYVAVDAGLYARCPDLPRTPLRAAVRAALLDEERTLSTRDVVIEALVHRLVGAR
ncbi:MAG: NAD(P)H-binding protein [Deltaproteobacteria bacterium]|nr:NAD(P)H-binding protein [Deltaproteobacteria bacterium]